MSDADTNISALRTGHDRLAGLVSRLSDADLARRSGASEWDVSQVLSHLGSGAEISHAVVRSALDGTPAPGPDFNPTVWARWDAMSRRERADGFLRSNPVLVETYESMDAGTRANLRIDLGFLPAPVDVATAAAMRLNEFALHSWDVHVGFDDRATVAAEATGPLLKVAAGLLGWISKPERLGGVRAVIRVTTTEPDSVFALSLGDKITVDSDVPDQPDGTLALPAEAWLRLTVGRLAARYTPEGVRTTGAADLDLLRQVFPGY